MEGGLASLEALDILQVSGSVKAPQSFSASVTAAVSRGQSRVSQLSVSVTL